MPSGEKTAAGKILHNSIWYGLETVLETIIALGASVAVARYLGPEKNGYFSFINFFVLTATRTSGSGIASATRKYMAEFLVIDRPGIAHGVYKIAYRYQLIGALIIALGGSAIVFRFCEPQYRLMSVILLVSVIPGLMSWVPAEANNAFEDMYPNTISALGYLVSYAGIIVLTIVFHWDLVGIASASLIGRTAEVLLRTVPLKKKFRQFPVEPVPDEVKIRMRQYCQQGLGVQALTILVYDRSEFFFLKYYAGAAAIGFYSVSAGLVDKLLLIPRTFGFATGATMVVEATRDASRMGSIVKNTCRFLLLVVFPINIGAAVLAKSAVQIGYGGRYAPAAPIMAVAAILGMPRAFQFITENLLRAADRQKLQLRWLVITAGVNIILDYFLIKNYGAVGAAWGNGLSQLFGTVALWFATRTIYNIRFPVAAAFRYCGAALVMGAVSFVISRHLPALPGFVLGAAGGAVTYLLMLKLFRAMDASDRDRLLMLAGRAPGQVRGPATSVIRFLAT